ncbi:hypothetical protein [Microbacterium sp. CFBP9034]|uniref:hypothetical protein n=1 Tax=Microbacterium sp. CFBP9034 TaxID=3096540 RepID=UPI002A6B7209|nr:hypothetical protein [Microbacterium sp. CFBP9034]MDY0909947.1 hypothetical protein [Microbacterium sp. CFBP9034]
MTSRTASLTLAVAVLVAALVGCSPIPVPSSEPTPGFSSEAEAFAAAEETYRAYVDALNRVDLSDPQTFEDVYAWTTGELNASDRKGLTSYHADGASVSGSSSVQLVELDTENDDGVTLAVCLDVSAIEVLSSSGESLVDDDRTAVQSLSVELAPDDTSPTGLLVQSIGPRAGTPTCTS